MCKSEARCRFCFYHSMMPWPQAANQTLPVWGGSLPGWQRKLLPFAADLHVHTMLRAISYGLRGRQVRQRHLVLFLRPAMLSCALTAGRGTARRRWYLGTANSKPASYHCRSLQGATFIRADGLGDYRGAVDLDMCYAMSQCWQGGVIMRWRTGRPSMQPRPPTGGRTQTTVTQALRNYRKLRPTCLLDALVELVGDRPRFGFVCDCP